MRTTRSYMHFFITAAVLIVSLAAGSPVWGQTATSIYQGLTLPVAALGSVDGSYGLSGIETVNLYNGKLNVNVPLLKVGGRGDEGYTITLAVQNNWQLSAIWDQATNSYTYSQNLLSNTQGGDPFGPGTLLVKSQYDGTTTCFVNGDITIATGTLTTLSFVRPDGSTIDLVDQATGGAEGFPTCGFTPSRGNVFQSRDGSNVTFIADSPVHDSTNPQGIASVGTGTLIFANGVRYVYQSTTINNGQYVLLAYICDRNGNRITFNYDSNGLISQIADGLNRVISISRSASQAVISYTGAGGTPEQITISGSSSLSTCLAPGYSPASYGQLFGSNYGSGSNLNATVCGVGSISLPNGQSYSFLYDSFGEVAQITLPTGGQIKYTWGVAGYGNAGAGYGDNGASVFLANANNTLPYVARMVQSRDVYVAGAIQQHTTYTQTPNGTVNVDHYDGNFSPLSREVHYFYGPGSLSGSCTASAPAWWPAWLEGKEYQTDEETAAGAAILRSTVQTWQQGACIAGDTCLGTSTPASCSPTIQYTASPVNPRLQQTKVTLADTNLVSLTTFGYDGFNNRQDTLEYDWGSGAPGGLIRQTHTTYVTANGYSTMTSSSSAETHLPSLVLEQQVKDASGNVFADTQYCYDQQTGGNCRTPTSLAGLSGTASGWSDPGNSQRGNVATIARMVSAGTYIQNSAAYDATGNIVSTTDARNNTTSYSYTDAFSTGTTLTNSSLTSWTFVPPCTTNCIANGFLTQITNAAGQQESATYDYYIGKPTTVTDVANSVSTGYVFNDSLGRLTNINYPDGGSVSYGYLDSSNTITTTALQTGSGDVCGPNSRSSQVFYDGLGRTSQTVATEAVNGASTQAVVQTTYDGLGRVYQVSNPYALGGSPSYNTTTTYDALNRVLRVTNQDASYRTVAYSGNTTTATDEAVHTTVTVTDALGRLKQVTEAPGYVTTYNYDVLDNLISVSQSGQSRTFAYDGLKRLTCAANPESSAAGATCPASSTGVDRYTYDANSNLLMHTDANGVAATSTYDALNRVTQKSYSDSTPTSYYCYDGNHTGNCSAAPAAASHAQRRLTFETNTNSASSFTNFDAMGRVLNHSQITSTLTYPFTYAYNLAGQLESETYPSGRKVTSCFDIAGRPSAVSGKLGAYTPAYASSVNYSLDGQMTSANYGNGLAETRGYSADRLQLTSIQAAAAGGTPLALGFTYVTSGQSNNTGNVLTQTITTPTVTHSQAYTYDSANRLSLVAESQSVSSPHNWSIGFGFDAFGNQWSSTALPPVQGAPTSQSQINAANNRLTYEGYDTAGHVTSDANLGTLTYTAEGQLSTVTNGGSTATYSYDAAGRRTKKVVTGAAPVTVTYVYDAAGELATEQWTNGVTDVGPQYLTQDHLGSTRLVTSASGACVSRLDYFPYGEQIPNQATYGNRDLECGTGTGVTERFTGKERDVETGLDYFGARSYSSTMGRWTDVDPKQFPHQFGDPQSWDKYVYSRNNPLRNVDRDGRDWNDIVADAKRYFSALFQPVSGVDEVTRPQVSSGAFSGPWIDEHDVAVAYTREAGSRLDTLASFYEAADFTGISSVARAGLQRNGPGLTMAVGGVIVGVLIPGPAGGKKLALGLADQGLESFAKGHGLQTLFSYGDKWRTAFMSLMGHEGTQVVFRLDGVSVQAGIQRAASGSAKATATDWELYQIYQHPEWWDRITWTSGGQSAANPFR